jgi:hypothetical protein
VETFIGNDKQGNSLYWTTDYKVDNTKVPGIIKRFGNGKQLFFEFPDYTIDVVLDYDEKEKYANEQDNVQGR